MERKQEGSGPIDEQPRRLNLASDLKSDILITYIFMCILSIPEIESHITILYSYGGEQNPWVKGSVCSVLKFALPPFSPPLPSVVEVLKQNRH